MSLEKFRGKIPRPNFHTIQNQTALQIQTFDQSLVKETTEKGKLTFSRLKGDVGSQKLKVHAKIYWDYDPTYGKLYTEEWVNCTDDLSGRLIIKYDDNFYLCAPPST